MFFFFVKTYAQQRREKNHTERDREKWRHETTVSINLWKILAGHTGDWFDVKTALICTTDFWDALKSFILTSLKFKVAPYPIIVSLDGFPADMDVDIPIVDGTTPKRLRREWQVANFKNFALQAAESPSNRVSMP